MHPDIKPWQLYLLLFTLGVFVGLIIGGAHERWLIKDTVEKYNELRSHYEDCRRANYQAYPEFPKVNMTEIMRRLNG